MIFEIIQKVKAEMLGRVADEHNNVRLLMEAVMKAGDGDYLEVGVLHGGSLCAVALLKKELDHRGVCVGIDPLNGYYVERVPSRNHKLDIESWVPVTPQTVYRNIKQFKLDNVEIVQSKSNPLPIDKSRKFAVAYIDGDHWDDGPQHDWDNISPLVTRFMVLDNYDEKHPAVIKTCDKAAKDKHWRTYLQEGMTYILERVV